MISDRSTLLLFALCSQTLFAPLTIPNWKMVQSMDADHSGEISREEFLSSDKVFHAIDQNKDGNITFKEVEKARKSTPAAPRLGEVVPKLTTLDPKTGKPVDLHHRDRPFALIFGTHT